jgi:UDP-N-acetylglucosamine acyltransferase
VPDIHPTAIIERGAELASDVVVHAYARVGPHVRIGPGTVLYHGALVEGHTTIGARTQIHPYACVGITPQDKKYRGEPSRLEIGDGNAIREYVTMNPGTEAGGMVTTVGAGSLFMANAHVGHDCRVGDHVVVANSAALAGHVTVESHAIVGGLAGVHQFTRVGESAMCGAGAMVSQDVPPFEALHVDDVELQVVLGAQGVEVLLQRLDLVSQHPRPVGDLVGDVEGRVCAPRGDHRRGAHRRRVAGPGRRRGERQRGSRDRARRERTNLP